MTARVKTPSRSVQAVHGVQQIGPDPAHELALSKSLLRKMGKEGLEALYGRFAIGDGVTDRMMRRAIWRALAHRFGRGVCVESGVQFKHPETFEIGHGVFLGAQSYLQGRYDGKFVVGDHVWIGPQSYFDARDLVLEEYVGWGPGAKVLGSEHTGVPTDMPIIQTDLVIKPVRVKAWADIGTNAVLLPGVTVGKASIVGAGAVVAEDVPDFAVVAGVPARFLRWRDGRGAQGKK